ncbi:hypothetical protein H0H81_009509 [Sphagnurus paluster]|uniref:Uncharacterized protein n=1 Tax=Sphagnurus paluster TaxID=117069 RepID=A0A9P7GKZ1_9AGAR|nr:hypothetical protein H0H81_009509 [Sphagnurus paluster]
MHECQRTSIVEPMRHTTATTNARIAVVSMAKPMPRTAIHTATLPTISTATAITIRMPTPIQAPIIGTTTHALRTPTLDALPLEQELQATPELSRGCEPTTLPPAAMTTAAAFCSIATPKPNAIAAGPATPMCVSTTPFASPTAASITTSKPTPARSIFESLAVLPISAAPAAAVLTFSSQILRLKSTSTRPFSVAAGTANISPISANGIFGVVAPPT